MKMACLIWILLMLICKYCGAEISDIEEAMIAIFYVGDCVYDLTKEIKRRNQ